MDCSYIVHISTAHGIQIKEKCNQCDKMFVTQRELSQHIKENHKSHKPCDYFKEDRCDLDEECRYKHIKLNPGEQICFTFKKKNISKKGNVKPHQRKAWTHFMPQILKK